MILFVWHRFGLGEIVFEIQLRLCVLKSLEVACASCSKCSFIGATVALHAVSEAVERAIAFPAILLLGATIDGYLGPVPGRVIEWSPLFVRLPLLAILYLRLGRRLDWCRRIPTGLPGG